MRTGLAFAVANYQDIGRRLCPAVHAVETNTCGDPSRLRSASSLSKLDIYIPLSSSSLRYLSLDIVITHTLHAWQSLSASCRFYDSYRFVQFYLFNFPTCWTPVYR